MFTKIIVPLDNSALAEQALPFALRLATVAPAKLILLHITKLPLLLDDYAQEEREVVTTAQEYLESLKQKLTKTNFAGYHVQPDQLETLLSYGDPAQEILRVATAREADLIVMSTHGRSGIAQLIQGSVAKHILQHSQLPVILVRPTKAAHPQLISEQKPTEVNKSLSRDREIQPVIIALDGTKEAEQALAPAMEIALQLKAPVRLLNVAAPAVLTHAGVPGLDYIQDLYGAEITARKLNNQFSQYLGGLQKDVIDSSLDCTTMIRVGETIDEIVIDALAVQAALVVMVSHSRNKLGMGTSVAEQVMRQTYLPVMLIYPVAHEIETAASTTPAVF